MPAVSSALGLPRRRRWNLTIAIPSSIVTDVPHLREKTSRLGFLGRALGIYRVNEILIYRDMPPADASREERLVSSVLTYMETPQYLRRHLVPLDPDLRFAGILPPLRTPNHPVSGKLKDLKIGEIREGVVTASDIRTSQVDIGTGDAVNVLGKITRGKRCLVRIRATTPKIVAELTQDNRIDIYWGFRVTLKTLPLGRVIQEDKPDLVIATSRIGENVETMFDELKAATMGASSVLLAFGSPRRGLKQILDQEGTKLESVARFIVNFVPYQGTQTVRTEEAVHSALAILNAIAE